MYSTASVLSTHRDTTNTDPSPENQKMMPVKSVCLQDLVCPHSVDALLCTKMFLLANTVLCAYGAEMFLHTDTFPLKDTFL